MTKSPVLAFAARAEKSKPRTLQVLIYDEIGDTGWGDGFTAKQLRGELKKAGEIDVINLRINSPGGITTDGFAIYNALREHPARVEVDIDGNASSMASVIAQAGDVRRMANNAEMMIHEAKVPIMGFVSAGKLRSLAEHVDVINGNIASIYVTATKRDEDEIRQWMADETFMSAETAKERGFVDEVTAAGAKAAAKAWSWLDEAKGIYRWADELPPVPEAVAAAVAVVAPIPAEPAAPIELPPVEPKPVQQQLPLVAMLPTQAPATPGRKVAMDMRAIASALQLGAEADGPAVLAAVERTVKERNEAIAQRNALLQSAGVTTVEEGVGLITAGVAALDNSRALAARVEGLEKAAEDQKRADIIGRIKADGKCTPAMEISVFPAMSTAALEHFEKSAPRVIGKTGIREPARGSNPDVLPTWNGKTWEQMKPLERYQLGRENLDLFNAMRECAR
jgi:ATP-dependent protease ClpP protease subunit